MLRPFVLAALLATSATAQEASAPYIAALDRIGTLPPLTSPACLSMASDIPPSQARATIAASDAAPYVQPFDDAAIDGIVAVFDDAITGTPDAAPLLDQPGLPVADDIAGIRDFIVEFGLDPGNLVDLSAVYLVMLSIASTGDMTPIQEARTFATLRDQIAVSEALCFQLGRALTETPDLRDRLIVRAGLMIDGFEYASRIGEADAFAAAVAERSGFQLAERTLTANGLR